MKKIPVAVAQYALVHDIQENLKHARLAVQEAANKETEIVLLPELGTLPYFCIEQNKTYFDLAETIPGPTTEKYCALAKKFSIIIVTTLFEKLSGNNYYNTAVVIEKNGHIAGLYRKMHVPNDPGYYERFYFTPGDQGFKPVETCIGKLGVMICYDQWFPEAARTMALAGADMLLYPSAIGFDPDDNDREQIRQRNAWITIQKAHAIANGLPVLFSNRIGTESATEKNGITTGFWGSSHIIGPFGEVLAKAPVDQTTVITAEIDPDETKHIRNIWPFLDDRRTDAYEKPD